MTSLEPSQHKDISRKIKLELTVTARLQLIKLHQIVDASIGVKTLPGKGPFSPAPGASSSRPTSAAIRSCPLQHRGLLYIVSRASDTHAALLRSEQLIYTPVFRQHAWLLLSRLTTVTAASPTAVDARPSAVGDRQSEVEQHMNSSLATSSQGCTSKQALAA